MLSPTVEVGEQRVVLEHHVHRALVGRVAGDVAIAQEDPAARRELEAADHAQGRRLAAAGRAEQREELASGDVEGHLVDGDDLAEPLGDAVELDLTSGRGDGRHRAGRYAGGASCEPERPGPRNPALTGAAGQKWSRNVRTTPAVAEVEPLEDRPRIVGRLDDEDRRPAAHRLVPPPPDERPVGATALPGGQGRAARQHDRAGDRRGEAGLGDRDRRRCGRGGSRVRARSARTATRPRRRRRTRLATHRRSRTRPRRSPSTAGTPRPSPRVGSRRRRARAAARGRGPSPSSSIPRSPRPPRGDRRGPRGSPTVRSSTWTRCGLARRTRPANGRSGHPPRRRPWRGRA